MTNKTKCVNTFKRFFFFGKLCVDVDSYLDLQFKEIESKLKYVELQKKHLNLQDDYIELANKQKELLTEKV